MPRHVALPISLPPRMLNMHQAAAYFGVSLNTFRVMVEEDRVPKPKSLTGARIAWDRLELDAAADRLDVRA